MNTVRRWCLRMRYDASVWEMTPPYERCFRVRRCFRWEDDAVTILAKVQRRVLEIRKRLKFQKIWISYDRLVSAFSVYITSAPNSTVQPKNLINHFQNAFEKLWILNYQSAYSPGEYFHNSWNHKISTTSPVYGKKKQQYRIKLQLTRKMIA